MPIEVYISSTAVTTGDVISLYVDASGMDDGGNSYSIDVDDNGAGLGYWDTTSASIDDMYDVNGWGTSYQFNYYTTSAGDVYFNVDAHGFADIDYPYGSYANISDGVSATPTGAYMVAPYAMAPQTTVKIRFAPYEDHGGAELWSVTADDDLGGSFNPDPFEVYDVTAGNGGDSYYTAPNVSGATTVTINASSDNGAYGLNYLDFGSGAQIKILPLMRGALFMTGF